METQSETAVLSLESCAKSWLRFFRLCARRGK